MKKVLYTNDEEMLAKLRHEETNKYKNLSIVAAILVVLFFFCFFVAISAAAVAV